MVCVHHGPNGEHLIKRGSKLAKLYHCPLYILTILPGDLSELEPNQADYMSQWKNISDELGATFVVKTKEGRKPATVIKDIAGKYDITQLIIGQSGQTRWQEIIHGCFFNDLLDGLGEIDLHVVSIQRITDNQN